MTRIVNECPSDPGGGDPGDPGGGLTPEQLQAIAAVIEALQSAQNFANRGWYYLINLNSLHASLSTLQAALNDAKGQASSAVATINDSLALVSQYLQKGQRLGPEALEMINRQVAIAILQQGLAEEGNKST